MRRVRLAGTITSMLLLMAGVSSTAAVAEPAAEHHGAGVLVWSRFDGSHDGTGRIVRADPDGEHVRAITHPPTGVFDEDPKISPDGRRVLFARNVPSQGLVEIGVVGIDGRGERILDLHCTDPCVGVEGPNWTPDGRQLVYGRIIGPIDPTNGNAVGEPLYRSDLDGGFQTRLTSFDAVRASFAPDGYIVFLRPNPSDGHTAVFRMDADGGHVRQLTPWSIDADLPDVSPATSGPTRNLVVFETYGQGPPGGTASAVATVPATCQSLEQCTHQIRYLTSSTALPDQNFNPSWSPNGRQIIYCHFAYVDPGPAVGDIWTMRFNGTGKTPVSTDPRFEFRPAWGRLAPSN